MDEQTAPLEPQTNIFKENDKLFNQQPKTSGGILTKTLWGLAMLFVIVAVVFGGYMLGLKQQKQNPFAAQSQQILSPTQYPTAIPTSSWKLTFQDSISTYCPQITVAPGSGYYKMDLSKLAIKIDSSVVTPATTGQVTPKCWGQKGTDYISFSSTQGVGFTIFDDKSVETGHGGYPQIKPVGTKFYDQDGITLYFFRAQQIGSYIGTEPIVVRGFRKLTWPTGENMYVATGISAIPASDPRLLSLLNAYAVDGTDEFSKGHMIVDLSKEQQLEDVLTHTFFTDINTMKNPEKDAVQAVLKNLNAFSIR